MKVAKVALVTIVLFIVIALALAAMVIPGVLLYYVQDYWYMVLLTPVYVLVVALLESIICMAGIQALEIIDDSFSD